MRKLWILSIVVSLFAARAFAEPKDVTFAAADGFMLKGTFYPARVAAAGILLLHQCNADHQIYNELATLLSNAGYHVLAFDFRGFGKSKGGDYTDFAKQE
jgi:predicted alpha/beta hydrolase